MTTDIQDLARALAWLIERLGHTDDCSAKPDPEDGNSYSCDCGMSRALSAVQHGSRGDY
ncbi:MAG: hypothetical protein ACYTBS_23455 [Planctomycetota bacterium]|jgi:hypothetical protein